jgi:hypothetical protein
MRALDRLALLSTCAACTLGFFVMLAMPTVGPTKLPPSRQQPVIKEVDLSRLTPELRRAIESARIEGVRHARAELDKLHSLIMDGVDRRFLDWYFGYWVQQRRAIQYAFRWVTGTDPDDGLRQEIAHEFGLQVLPPSLLDEHLQRISRESVAVFVRALQDHLESIPKQYEIPTARWDAYLDSITTMVTETEGGRTVPLTLKAFAAGVAVSGAGVVTSLAPLLTRQLAKAAVAGPIPSGAVAGAIGRQIATTASRQAAGRGVAALAGSSTAITGGLILGALVAWEAWDHVQTVAKNRPLLRNNIDRLLTIYEAGLIEPTGMIGATLHELERKLVANLITS